MFYLAEYINMITVSAFATTLFLGGWRAPWPITLWHGANSGYFALIWWLVKVLILLFGFIWLRATLPRVRYDQFMRFGWKVLIPVNLVWILFLSAVRVANRELSTGTRFLVIGGLLVVVLLIVMLWPAARKARQLSLEEQIAARPPGSFPVPPIDLQVPPSPRARRAVAERAPAAVGGGPTDTPDDAPGKEI
jgi:NADH-quinone oxidoreductase subunit H